MMKQENDAERLGRLLCSLFGDGLRRFARSLPDGPEILLAVPSKWASAIDVSSAIVDELEKRGRIDTQLFRILRSQRPGRIADIDRVAAQVLFGSSPAATTVTDSHRVVRDTRRPSFDVFVAYAHADSAFADQLTARLSRTLRVFLDRQALPPGNCWPEGIRRAQAQAVCTVVLVSNASNRSRWVMDEALNAITLSESGHRVIPILLDRSTEIPYGLRTFNGLILEELGLDGIVETLERSVAAARTDVS